MDCLFLPADSPARLDADTPVYWLPKQGAGRWLRLDECAAAAQGAISLVLPAEACSFFAVSLPTRKARWMQQALAYVAEELLAENVDELHLALGETLADGRQRVVAIGRQRLGDWLAQLRELGLPIVAVHVDADLLPRDATQLLFLGERGLLGGAGETRLVFASRDWPALAGHCPPPWHAQGSEAEPPVPLEDYRPLDDPYAFLAGNRATAVNLAQGEFAVETGSTGLGYWKPLFAVVGLILLVQPGFNLVQAWYFQRQGDAYAEASQALYRELFPEDVRIVNLRAQFDDHLAQRSGGQASFLRLLEHTAGALEDGIPVTIGQLDYNQDRGDLALQVQAMDFATLETLRRRLGESGQSVQLGSASREGDGVSARVVIGG
ncbi:type II secretion system protein GspL [Pseudomonas lopnurensis]|uniref:type II secretion system protein GspL n=1 Tax=Pseudomonas lopnurensis TaxID=1477517 RepID=UPI0028AD4F23|nr:type II secretion system protein GspL [Pseudomonas lopnurensis]